jgi:hypothetical protein
MTSTIPYKIKKRIFVYVSYFNVLFFFEIINLMFLLLIVYGKFISISAGSILSILLSLQIINLYFKKEINRMIQLYVMDIHVAYCIPFVINFLINKNYFLMSDYFFMYLRLAMCCFDIIFIFALSDYREELYQ